MFYVLYPFVTYLLSLPRTLKQATNNFHVLSNPLFKTMLPWTLYDLVMWESIAK
jgi:hypothetical protein